MSVQICEKMEGSRAQMSCSSGDGVEMGLQLSSRGQRDSEQKISPENVAFILRRIRNLDQLLDM